MALVTRSRFTSPRRTSVLGFRSAWFLAISIIFAGSSCGRPAPGRSTLRPEQASPGWIAPAEESLVTTPQPQALLVVGNTTLSTGDTALRNRLANTLGYAVTVVADNLTAASVSSAASGKGLIVISESVKDTNVGGNYKTLPTSVVVLEPLLFDDMGMTLGTSNTDFGPA